MAAPQAEEVQKHPKNSTDRQHLQANPPLGLARPPGVQNPERPSALASRRQQSPRPVETEVAKTKIQTQSDGSDNGGRGATAEAVVVEFKARPDRTGDGLVKTMDDGDHVRAAAKKHTEGKKVHQVHTQKTSGAKKEAFKLKGLLPTSCDESAGQHNSFAHPHSFGASTASVPATDFDPSTLAGQGKACVRNTATSTESVTSNTGDSRKVHSSKLTNQSGATSSSTILLKGERWPGAVAFIRWFRKAIEDAKGFFEEAEWAESWLEACEGGRIMGNNAVDPPVSGRPLQHQKSGSASSAQRSHSAGNTVVSGLWKAVVGETSSPTHKRSELPILRTAFPKRKQIDAEQGIDERKVSLESEGAFQAGTVSATVETQPLFTSVYTQSPESYEPGVVQIVDGRSWDSEHHEPQVHIVDDDSPISDIPHNATGGLVPIEALKSPRSPLKTPAPKTTAITRPSVLKRQSTDNTSPKTYSLRYFITNPDSPQSPNATEPDEGPLLPVHKEPGYQPPTSESPKHSPRKSVVFDALPSLIKRESVSASTSPTKVGVAARRRLSQALSSSFHAISTATAPDILEQAEEGQPPFRSTFS
ncbi:hypothetical protein KC343_g13329, partial [Hortaea werneckii]